MMLRICWKTVCVVAVLLFSGAIPQIANAQETSELDAVKYRKIVENAIEYLRAQQNDDGNFGSSGGPGVTALVTTGLLRHGVSADEPVVAEAIEYLLSLVDPKTGGIHKPDSNHRNYETCLTVLCLAEANQDGKYDEILMKADRFIKNIQWGGPGDSTSEEDFAYGGAGYGSHARPDLSNTSFMIDALRATGNSEDSEAIQRALVFISRAQNLESDKNSTPFAAKNPDGGFFYTPAAGGETKAEPMENGGLRSYGSMTYVGLKSMIYAGVGRDDPRVKAATTWLRSNYSLEENPNMGATGLYYYYHTFAKALDALGEDEFADADGVGHDWRAELVEELASRQNADGSWVNSDAARWLEDDPVLVTGYCLLALSHVGIDSDSSR